MAKSSGKAMFSKVTATIDVSALDNPSKAAEVLKKYGHHRRKGPRYEIEDSFERLGMLYDELSFGKRSPKREQPDPARPVEVSEDVISFMEQRCSQHLQGIDKNVLISVQRAHGKTLVNFQPRRPTVDETRCHFARERFITLYQKIATVLQQKEFPADPKQLEHIESAFTDLVIRSNPATGSVSVTGRNAGVSRLESFLKRGLAPKEKPRGPSQRKLVDKPSPTPVWKQPADMEHNCPICLDTIIKSELKTLPRCQHSFCKGCLKRAFQSRAACPVCGTLYGEVTGTQPKNGEMEISTVKAPLPGYEGYGSIVIRYNIPSGIQGEEHPNPGQPYQGTSRISFLPDSPEGRKVVQLLQRAFNQRLVFTVGQSSTTGRRNVVTWNDIHHKTNRHGGPTNYGYPDPHYLDRVQEELRAKGIY